MRRRPSDTLLVSGCQATTRSTMAAATAPPNTPASTVNGSALVDDSARRISNGRLAFQLEALAGDHTQTEIHTVKPNGSDRTALTSTPDDNEFGPAWDATGARIRRRRFGRVRPPGRMVPRRRQ